MMTMTPDDMSMVETVCDQLDTLPDDVETYLTETGMKPFFEEWRDFYAIMDRIIVKMIDGIEMDEDENLYIEKYIQTIETKDDPLYAYFNVDSEKTKRGVLEGMENAPNYCLGKYRTLCIARLAKTVRPDLNLNWFDVSTVVSMCCLFS